jgi:hypothetical protein
LTAGVSASDETPTPAETPAPSIGETAGDAEGHAPLTPSPFASPTVSTSPLPQPAAAQVAPALGPPGGGQPEVTGGAPGQGLLTPPDPTPVTPLGDTPAAATESGEGAPFTPLPDAAAPQGPVIEHTPTAQPAQMVENQTGVEGAEVAAIDTPIADAPEAATPAVSTPAPPDSQTATGMAPEPSAATLPPPAAVFSQAETQVDGPMPASSPAFDASTASPAVGFAQIETQIAGPASEELRGLDGSTLPPRAPVVATPSQAETQIGVAPDSAALAFGAADAQPLPASPETTDPSIQVPAAPGEGLESTLISKDEPLDGLEVALTPGAEEPFAAPRQATEVLPPLDMPPPTTNGAADLTGAPAAFEKAASLHEVIATAEETDHETGNLLGASPEPAVDEEGLFGHVITRPKRRVPVTGLVAVLMVVAAAGGLWAFGIIDIPGAPLGPLAHLAERFLGPGTQVPAAAGPEEPPGQELAYAEPELIPVGVPAPKPEIDGKPSAKPNGKASGTTHAASKKATEQPAETAAVTSDQPEERQKKRKRRKKKASKTPKTPKTSKSPKPATATKKLSADDYYRKADSLMRLKKVPAAIDELKKAVAANPRHSKAHRLLGMAYWSIGKKKSAVTAFERFIKLDPRHKDVPKLKALIASQKK